MELFRKKEKQPKTPKAPKEKQPKVKRLRKHFSVLELVSTVAVLAIVGTVGFIVYKNHFKKQIPETDKELVNQLNSSFNKNFGNKPTFELKDVITGFENDGIVFSKLKLSDPLNEIIFDESERTFGIFESGKGVTYPVSIERSENKIDASLWKFAQKNPGISEKFSYYLLDGCSGNISAVGGIDVGRNDDIKQISYINPTNEKQTVTIKTNSFETNLVVSETTGDTINHYGRAGMLTVKRLHTDSYHEYGNLKYAYIPNGRVVAESNGYIDVAIVTSEVAFVQEKGTGSIGRAFAGSERVRNASQKTDDKYGKKKELEYDDSLSRDENERQAIIIAEAALNSSIVAERIERGLENHPNAIGYTREGDTITIFDSYKDAVEFFKDGREGLVTVTGSEYLTEELVIKDLNVTFRGQEGFTTNINGNIKIENTTGLHHLKFENISFINESSTKDTIRDCSYAQDELHVNILEFNNCTFSYSNEKDSKKAAIALCPSGDFIGTHLQVKNCTFDCQKGGLVGITTRGLLDSSDSLNRGEPIVSLKKHLVDSSTFNCKNVNNNPALVVNYAEVTNNSFTNYDTVFRFLPSKLSGNTCQFDVSVAGSKFTNARYLFSLMDVDDCYEAPEFKFNFFGSNSNSFSKVQHIGTFDVSTTNRYIESTIEEWVNKPWSGVTDPSVGVTLDSITMNLETAPYFGVMTLQNGDRVKTYTQVEDLGGRTGYTVKDVDDNLYYFYMTINEEVNMFFKEGTNEAYISLLSDGDVETLKVKELDENLDWFDEDLLIDEEKRNELKYFDVTQEDTVGALYKVNYSFTTIGGNTYKNCEVEETENFVEVGMLDESDPNLPSSSCLPSGYQEIESITFSKTNGYVDTGIVINDATSLHLTLDAKYYGDTLALNMFTGFIASGSTPRLGVSVYQGNYMVGINETIKSSTPYHTDRSTFEFYTNEGKQYFDIDGASIIDGRSISGTLSSNVLSLYVGARNNSGSAEEFSGITLYRFILDNNGELHNFIPCRRTSDGVLGLFDTRADSEQFKVLVGDGVAGPDVLNDNLPSPELYISDIGDKQKLVLTNEEPLVTNDNEYTVVVPEKSVVVLSGNFDVEIKGELKNITLVNQMVVSVLEGAKISEFMEISGENAEDLKLTNRGYINKLAVNSKAEVTNYSVINNLVTGDTSHVKEKNISSMLTNAIDAAIYNKGNIFDITTFAKTRLFNKQGGNIENLTINYIEGYRDLCAGSLIINDNIMCNSDGNISLYIECTFMNESIGRIGVLGRTTAGGCIIIGDHGNSDAHNRVVFINDGNIRAGRIDDDHVATFIVYGVNSDAGESSPKVRIESSGIITGTTSDEEILLVMDCDIPPTIDKDIKL